MDGVVKARNVLCHEIGGGVPALPWKSVYRAGRHHIGKLAHRIGDAAPYRRDVVIILRRQLLGASTAFVERLLAIPLKHQGGRAPDVDFRYHAWRLSPIGVPSRVKTVEHGGADRCLRFRSYRTDRDQLSWLALGGGVTPKRLRDPADRCKAGPGVKSVGGLAPGDEGFGDFLQLVSRRPSLPNCQLSKHPAEPDQIVPCGASRILM
jgi:hypothetical protein